MNLSEQQEASEHRGLTDGEKRYIRRVAKAYEKGAATGAPPVRQFLECCVEWLEADLTLKVDELAAQPGPFPLWAEWVMRIGEDKVAYLTLKAALNGHAHHPSSHAVGRLVRNVSQSLVGMLVDEARAERFVAVDPAGFANATNHGGTGKRARALRLRKRMKYHGVDILPTPGIKDTIHIGSHLLAAMCEATGAFELTTERDYTKKRYTTHLILTPTEATLQWIATRSDRLRLTMPIHPPTLIPPRDWGPGTCGGYHYALADTLPLVRHVSPAQAMKLVSISMPLVYSALNALQRTAWRVNERVLEVVGAALDGKLAGLIPVPDDAPIPQRPMGVGDPVALRDWRIRAANVHVANDRRRVKRADAERGVVVARTLASTERFYYPYSLDFRGRAYPATEFLHPHGPDVIRGMLEFADGVRLSRAGAGWLAVHGANTLGTWAGKSLTKLTFQERVDTIKGLSDLILLAAEDPLGHRWWIEADDPWQFLAFIFEWAQWLKTNELESHIPVGLDGTANGIQHYSALLRDPVAAAAVNMTKTDRPVDIYATVAGDLLRRLGERAGEPIASLWLASGLVTRSIVKRPVMTLPYGATRYGFVDQILQTLREKDDVWNHTRKTFGLAGVKIRVAVQYLAALLWETLLATVGGALSAMEWLQSSTAMVVTVSGGPISWTVPLTGFPAHQEYWSQKRTQITTRMNGTILQPQVYTNTHNPHHRKIRNSVAPNFIHSLDAACMMSVVVACSARGVPAFTAIHDSYGVHANHVPVLSDAIRTSLIDLHYDRHILDHVASEWRALGADVPDPPPVGTYDIRDVRYAPYAFN